MNAAEHIVESYFRLVRKCFTLVDVKVENGNNRQLDILAYNVREGHAYHVEVGVTHRERWCPSLDELHPQFEKKFFGKPPLRDGANNGRTDSERGKNYWQSINETYERMGLRPESIARVWVCWTIKDSSRATPLMHRVYSEHLARHFEIEVVTLRDQILPALDDAIGTSNYDDEILRTLGFVKQREEQINKGAEKK